MNEPEIRIRTEPRPSPGARRGPSLSKQRWLIAACVLGLGLLAAIGMVIRGSRETPSNMSPLKKGKPAAPAVTTIPETTGGQAAAQVVAEEEVVEDPTGELLWASPTAGPPIPMDYVPAGAQCLVHLRPAQLAKHPEGERVLAALGPWGASAAAQASTLLGADVKEIESLLIAVVVSSGGKLDASLRASLVEPWDATQLPARFPTSQAKEYAGIPYRVQDERAWFVSSASASQDEEAIAYLVACPAELVEELINGGGAPPPLIRDVQRLVDVADFERLATVIVSPKFLQAGGSDLLIEEAAPLRSAINSLAAHDATALLLSAHWHDDFFLELRATPALNVPPRRLAVKLKEQIAAAPAAIEDQVFAAQFPPYGRKVLARFPAMLRALSRYARAGDSGGCAVIRAYLPTMAGHNLLMAAELLLTQSRSGETVAAATDSHRPATTEERLDAVTSLSFSKDSLERALELLAEDVGVEISIDGPALQLEGITKNQSLAIDLRELPAREILLQILLKANPDRTAAGPADARQKLVYTVEAGESGAPGRIIVTTRAAADRRGGPLPDAFHLKLP